MGEITRALSWPGIFAAALFLWLMRFGLRRLFDQSENRTASVHVADRGGPLIRECAVFIVCLIVAASLAVVQNALRGHLDNAVGIGFLLSVVPAAALLGVGAVSRQKHRTVRAAGVVAGCILCSMIVHAFAH